MDCKVVIAKLKQQEADTVSIAYIPSVVNPRGQELAFSKCLCCLVFLVGIFHEENKRKRRGNKEGKKSLFPCLFLSQDAKQLYFQLPSGSKNVGCSISVTQ